MNELTKVYERRKLSSPRWSMVRSWDKPLSLLYDEPFAANTVDEGIGGILQYPAMKRRATSLRGPLEARGPRRSYPKEMSIASNPFPSALPPYFHPLILIREFINARVSCRWSRKRRTQAGNLTTSDSCGKKLA